VAKTASKAEIHERNLPEVVHRDLRPGEVRIIGIELRAQDRNVGTTEELALFPCNIVVRCAEGVGVQYPITIHTSRGDVNITGQQLV